jgi:hypothetical protein
LHKVIDRLDGVATLELHSEGVFIKCDACLFHVILQGRLEKPLKMSGSFVVGHLTIREEMVSIEEGLAR